MIYDVEGIIAAPLNFEHVGQITLAVQAQHKFILPTDLVTTCNHPFLMSLEADASDMARIKTKEYLDMVAGLLSMCFKVPVDDAWISGIRQQGSTITERSIKVNGRVNLIRKVSNHTSELADFERYYKVVTTMTAERRRLSNAACLLYNEALCRGHMAARHLNECFQCAQLILGII